MALAETERDRVAGIGSMKRMGMVRSDMILGKETAKMEGIGETGKGMGIEMVVIRLKIGKESEGMIELGTMKQMEMTG